MYNISTLDADLYTRWKNPNYMTLKIYTSIWAQVYEPRDMVYFQRHIVRIILVYFVCWHKDMSLEARRQPRRKYTESAFNILFLNVQYINTKCAPIYKLKTYLTV